MIRETLHLEAIKLQVAALPLEHRAEVAKLLSQIQAVLKTASNGTVASAAVALFSAISISAQAEAARMASSSNQPH